MSENKISSMSPMVLDSIAEHSPAGFLLFYVNGEGAIQVHSAFDSEMSALALQHFCSTWTKAVAKNQEEFLLDLFDNLNSPSTEED